MNSLLFESANSPVSIKLGTIDKSACYTTALNGAWVIALSGVTYSYFTSTGHSTDTQTLYSTNRMGTSNKIYQQHVTCHDVTDI